MRNIFITDEHIEELILQLRQEVKQMQIGQGGFTLTLENKKKETKEHLTPTVIMSELADQKIKALVEECSTEVAWHGLVDRNEKTNEYFIKDILVFPQEVTASTAVATDDYGLWLAQLTNEDFSALRFHGHSHVNMGVSPSVTDLTYHADMLNNIQDYYIFAIFNKKGAMNIWIYDVKQNLMYETADIDCYSELEETEWAKEQLKELVSKPAPIAPTYNALSRVISVKKPMPLSTYDELKKETAPQLYSGYDPRHRDYYNY